MRLPIGLHGVLLRAPLALPLLLAVLSTKVLFDAREVSQCSRRAVVNAGRFWTHVDSLANLFARSLLELPRQVVASPVKLKVLVALKPFVADLTHKPVRRHQSLGR